MVATTSLLISMAFIKSLGEAIDGISSANEMISLLKRYVL